MSTESISESVTPSRDRLCVNPPKYGSAHLIRDGRRTVRTVLIRHFRRFKENA